MKKMRNRIEKIEHQVSPRRYAGIEDILRLIHLKRQKSLTERESRILEELEKLQIHPNLEKAFKEINENKRVTKDDRV